MEPIELEVFAGSLQTIWSKRESARRTRNGAQNERPAGAPTPETARYRNQRMKKARSGTCAVITFTRRNVGERSSPEAEHSSARGHQGRQHS
jgi:hypothetical protein